MCSNIKIENVIRRLKLVTFTFAYSYLQTRAN